MIAVCPTCHTACHLKHSLKIDTKTIYRWKHYSTVAEMHGHLYVAPGTAPLLRCGTLGITSNSPDNPNIFNTSEYNSLGFRLMKNNEILQLKLKVKDLSNNPI